MGELGVRQAAVVGVARGPDGALVPISGVIEKTWGGREAALTVSAAGPAFRAHEAGTLAQRLQTVWAEVTAPK